MYYMLTTRPFEIIIANATKRSVSGAQELTRLIHFIPSQKLAKFPQVLRLFLNHLKERTYPNDPNQPLVEAFAEASLGGVEEVMKELGPSWAKDDSTFLVQDFTRSWSDIWRWMKHLYSKAESRSTVFDPVNNPPFLASIDESNLTTMLHIMAKFCDFRNTSATRAIVSTPGVYTLVTDIWIRQCDRDSAGPDVSYACLTALQLLIALLESGAAGVKDIAEAPVADLKRISSTVLKMIQMSTRGSLDGTFWLGVFPLLLTLTEQLAQISPRLDHILLSQNSIVDVCRALAFHSSSSLIKSPVDTGMTRLCVIGSFLYLGSAILQTDGFTWINQAVHTGLITSLLRCVCWGFDDVDEQALAMLKSLMKYTVYRSLLRPSREALKDPTIPILEAQMSKKNAFWKAWVAFKSLLKERLMIKAKFDERGKYSQTCCSTKVSVNLQYSVILASTDLFNNPVSATKWKLVPRSGYVVVAILSITVPEHASSMIGRRVHIVDTAKRYPSIEQVCCTSSPGYLNIAIK